MTPSFNKARGAINKLIQKKMTDAAGSATSRNNTTSPRVDGGRSGCGCGPIGKPRQVEDKEEDSACMQGLKFSWHRRPRTFGRVRAPKRKKVDGRRLISTNLASIRKWAMRSIYLRADTHGCNEGSGSRNVSGRLSFLCGEDVPCCLSDDVPCCQKK